MHWSFKILDETQDNGGTVSSRKVNIKPATSYVPIDSVKQLTCGVAVNNYATLRSFRRSSLLTKYCTLIVTYMERQIGTLSWACATKAGRLYRCPVRSYQRLKTWKTTFTPSLIDGLAQDNGVASCPRALKSRDGRRRPLTTFQE